MQRAVSGSTEGHTKSWQVRYVPLAGPARDAFERYERELRPYVETNLAYGVKMAGDMVPGGRWNIALRNYGMRTLRFNPWKRQIIEQVTRPLHVAANAITL